MKAPGDQARRSPLAAQAIEADTSQYSAPGFLLKLWQMTRRSGAPIRSGPFFFMETAQRNGQAACIGDEVHGEAHRTFIIAPRIETNGRVTGKTKRDIYLIMDDLAKVYFIFCIAMYASLSLSLSLALLLLISLSFSLPPVIFSLSLSPDFSVVLCLICLHGCSNTIWYWSRRNTGCPVHFSSRQHNTSKCIIKETFLFCAGKQSITQLG